jgi:hypothetical protein
MITLAGAATAAVLGGVDLGLEASNWSFSGFSAADVARTAVTLGAVAAQYAKASGRYDAEVTAAFYAELPLFEKTVYNQARRLMGGKVAGVRAVAVRAASSGLGQFANPALSGNYRSISA